MNDMAYAASAADGVTQALASLESGAHDGMTYGDALDHLTEFLEGMDTGPAAEGLKAALRDLVEDHDYDDAQDWDEGVPMDSYAGAVGYLTYYRDQISTGYYGRALLVGEAV
jgi:hypothetical protein